MGGNRACQTPNRTFLTLPKLTRDRPNATGVERQMLYPVSTRADKKLTSDNYVMHKTIHVNTRQQDYDFNSVFNGHNGNALMASTLV
jgi:hypothetical protein